MAGLSNLLEEQNREYGLLAGSYQELFDNLQELQTEFMQTCVAFEHKILDLEVEKRRLRGDIRKLERNAGQPATGTVSQKEYMDLGIRLKQALNVAARYTKLYEETKAALGDLAPQDVANLQTLVDALNTKVDQYRNRCLQLEAALKQQGGS